MNPSDQARQIGVVDSWLAQVYNMGGTVNPGDSTVVGDTGPLPAGHYDFFITWGATIELTMSNFDICWRNAANSADRMYIGAMAPANDIRWFKIENYKMATDERVRGWVSIGFTGKLGVTILAVRRA